MEIKVKCKRCSRLAKPEEFVLDNVYRLMVCPACVKERKSGEQARQELKVQQEAARKEEKKKPLGWDAEDEYLDRAYRDKMMTAVAVEKVSDDKVKYKCIKCKYEFLYNFVRKTPANCPYCGMEISKLRLRV